MCCDGKHVNPDNRRFGEMCNEGKFLENSGFVILEPGECSIIN